MARESFSNAFAVAMLLGTAMLAASLSAATTSIPAGTVAATASGNDLILSFPTTSPGLYSMQTSADLLQPFTNSPSVIAGDGTVKSVTLTNALAASQGFYRLLIQTPAALLLPQGMALAILGHDCNGIREQVHVTGFDPVSGYPTGVVYLSTTCPCSGRGCQPRTYTAWASVTWDLAGNAVSATGASSTSFDPTFLATDASGNTIYNLGTQAYLVVPLPAAPGGVTAVQVQDEFQVSWMPMGVIPAAIASSTVTATPVNSTNPVLTATVVGSGTNAVISPLQPATTYQISVVTTSITGSGPASAPISVTSSPATIAPLAPTNVAAIWGIPAADPGPNVLIATWAAAVPGNSPIDLYQIVITSDSGSTLTSTVSGTTLSASFNVDSNYNWSVTVQARNAFGWGPSSSVFTLGGL
jgi:hypothetical protein